MTNMLIDGCQQNFLASVDAHICPSSEHLAQVAA